jgi:hypothetical protein
MGSRQGHWVRIGSSQPQAQFAVRTRRARRTHLDDQPQDGFALRRDSGESCSVLRDLAAERLQGDRLRLGPAAPACIQAVDRGQLIC